MDTWYHFKKSNQSSLDFSPEWNLKWVINKNEVSNNKVVILLGFFSQVF